MGKNLKGKELGEGLSQLKDGRYCGRYTTKYGKRKTLYDKDLKTLKKRIEKERYEERFYNREVVDNTMTLNDVHELWIAKKKRTVKASTVSEYEYMYSTHIQKSIGDCKVTSITTNDIDLLFYRLQDKLQYGTIFTIKNILNNIFEFAIKQHICITNPVKYAEVGNKKEAARRKKERAEHKYLTREQREIFLTYAEKKNCKQLPVYKTMLYTGLRLGEVIALTWDDVDFENKIITVNKTFSKYNKDGEYVKTYTQSPKTLTSERKVPMCQVALETLQKQRTSKYTGNKFVFLTIRKTPYKEDNVTSHLKNVIRGLNDELKKQAELEHVEYTPFPNITSHFFRHTFASMCVEQGIAPKIIQKYMGHATIQMTMDIYAHVSNDIMMDEISKLDVQC